MSEGKENEEYDKDTNLAEKIDDYIDQMNFDDAIGKESEPEGMNNNN